MSVRFLHFSVGVGSNLEIGIEGYGIHGSVHDTRACPECSTGTQS